MQTLKLKGKVTPAEVELEFNLPYFCKRSGEYMKVISEEEMVTVYVSPPYKSMIVCSPSLRDSAIVNGDAISEKEFDDAMQAFHDYVEEHLI